MRDLFWNFSFWYQHFTLIVDIKNEIRTSFKSQSFDLHRFLFEMQHWVEMGYDQTDLQGTGKAIIVRSREFEKML